MLDVKNHVASKLIDTKSFHLHKDWFTGEKDRYFYPIAWIFLKTIKLIKSRIMSLRF